MLGGYVLPVVPVAERGDLTAAVRIRMSQALLRQIQKVAGETGRANADVMRLLMVAGLEAYEKEKKSKK
jgi:hypothetical protein